MGLKDFSVLLNTVQYQFLCRLLHKRGFNPFIFLCGGLKGFGSSKPSKPKKSTFSKLKKAAVIGAGAYIGYKVTKATGKALKNAFGGREIKYDSWNTWRQRYGFLCKIDNHCNWLDRNLECQQGWIKPTGWTLSPDVSFID